MLAIAPQLTYRTAVWTLFTYVDSTSNSIWWAREREREMSAYKRWYWIDGGREGLNIDWCWQTTPRGVREWAVS